MAAARHGSAHCPAYRCCWGAHYDRSTLVSDGVAALIVTLMLIPQSLAYALLAGLPPEVGCTPASRRCCCTRCSAPAARWPWGRRP
jgi:hypothetical protein